MEILITAQHWTATMMELPVNPSKGSRFTPEQVRTIVAVVAVVVAVVMVLAGYRLDQAQRPAGPKPPQGTSLTVSPAATDPHHYANCDQAWADGRANIPRGDIDYHPALDRDGDGVACKRGGG